MYGPPWPDEWFVILIMYWLWFINVTVRRYPSWLAVVWLRTTSLYSTSSHCCQPTSISAARRCPSLPYGSGWNICRFPRQLAGYTMSCRKLLQGRQHIMLLVPTGWGQNLSVCVWALSEISKDGIRAHTRSFFTINKLFFAWQWHDWYLIAIHPLLIIVLVLLLNLT